MKKSFIALVALGAFAGVASAQANVTIYGSLDAGITYEQGGAVGNIWKLATGVSAGNRIGFKGTEDLGGGMNAHFQLENGFDLDTGALRQGSRLFGRQAYVGIGGSSFGSIDFGRQYTPMFIAMDYLDPFDYGLLGANTNIINTGTLRTDNSIQYTTPTLNGFSASVLYGFGEQPGNTSLNSTFDFSLSYRKGPLGAYLAYDGEKLTATNTQKIWLVGGTYDFGPAKAYLAYLTEKDDAAMDYRDILVGVSAPLGTGTVLASYTDKKDKSAAGNTGGKQFALGYTYPLSKRTNFYTSYGRISNNAQAKYFVGDSSSGGSVPLVGNSSSAVTFGVRHTF